MNLIVLSLTYIFCKCFVSLRWLRMGLAALCGAVAAVLLLLFGPGYGWATAAMAFLVVPAMLFIAFGWHGKKDFLLRIGISWLSIVLLNGITEAFCNLTGIRSLTCYVGIAVLLIAVLLMELLRTSVRRQGQLCQVTLKQAGYHVECLGLYDSGNLLTMPKTGEPVHIVSPSLLKRLGMDEDRDCRKIPFRALGTNEGWICVVQVEQMQVHSGHRACVLSNVWLGKAQENLLVGKNYQMILNENVERNLS